jgi:hypothetical protein
LWRQLVELSLIFRQAAPLLRTHIPQTLLHVRRGRGWRLLPIRTLRTIIPVDSAVFRSAPILVATLTIVVLIPTLAIVVCVPAVRICRLPIGITAPR